MSTRLQSDSNRFKSTIKSTTFQTNNQMLELQESGNGR